MTAAQNKPHQSASLYVGDLAPDVTENVLYEVFNQVGPVASIRVCRDAKFRRSLGYAYVNFHSVQDAERALDVLNGQLIRGKPCRIMWSQRDPSIRKSGLGNLFIKNLDPTIGYNQLHDTFSVFGNILSCKVATDENGKSKGFGFVHFENVESAEKAINKLNGKMLGSKIVYVGPFLSRKEREKLKEKSWTNVFVKEIPPENCTEEGLKELFKPYGEITSVCLKQDNKGRYFGFVNFKRHEDAERAVKELNDKVISGKKLYCARAQKKSEREAELKKRFEQLRLERMTQYSGINLYVKNLEDEIDEERLRKEFSQFGTVKNVKIMMDPEKKISRGFGFVCFTTPEEAQRAIAEMNGRILPGCHKPLYVNLHEPREQRRQKLMQQYARSRNFMRGPVPGAGPALYPTPGAPMFYPPVQGFMYPPQHPMMPRPRGWPPVPQGQYPIPNYPMNVVPPGAMGTGSRPGRGRGMAQGGGRRTNTQAARRADMAANATIAMPPTPQLVAQPGIPPVPIVGLSQPEGVLPVPPPGPVPLPISIPPSVPEVRQHMQQLPPEQQRLFLGEQLFAAISKSLPKVDDKMDTKVTGKITGMLLDSEDNDTLLQAIFDENVLIPKIQECLRVLKEAVTQGDRKSVV